MDGDKFMPEIHLKQPSFTYSVCDPFTRNQKRIEKFIQTGNTRMSWIKPVFNTIWLIVNQKI